MQNVGEQNQSRFGVSKKELSLPALVICTIMIVLGAALSATSALSLFIPSVAKNLLLAIENSGVQDMEKGVEL